MSHKKEKIMQKLALILIMIAGILAVFFILTSLTRTQGVSKDNNVYVRYIACALSVDPEERRREIIKDCWDHVTEEADREVHRYDNIEDDNHFWFKEIDNEL